MSYVRRKSPSHSEIGDRPEPGAEQLDGTLLPRSASGTTSNVNALTLAIATTRPW